ncbi:hypothetical protein M8J75_011571 [Diaphorina citri]|nr:hypothetical protein M8J75_011571 [Diaphorina citri]
MAFRHRALLLSLLPLAAAQVETTESASEECLSSSSIVWAVIITIMILLAISVGVYTLWRYYWRSRKGEHLVLVTADPEKGDKFAFDNHAFKEGTPIIRTLEDDKLKGIKWPEFVSAQNENAKTKSLDDSCIGQEPAKNIVPLRSHDFTGLGFNIYGNMRDGIYVKEVSHRGPASESGRIQPGDRITSVRISFRHMVYEDALTILSYASPYEVQIETESNGSKVNSRPSTLLRHKQAPSTPAERIIHPFFRSQSISDLTQISSKPSSKRTSMNSSHHNTLHLSSHETSESKPAVLDISPCNTVSKPDKAHKFGIRVLPDMKPEEFKVNNQPVVLTMENENNSSILIEHNKTQKSHNEREVFDEIDLSNKCQATDETDCKTPSPPTNVKSIIAKGLQNLKDKLHQPHHKKQNSLEIANTKHVDTPDSCVIDMVPSNQHVPHEMNVTVNNSQDVLKSFLDKEKAFAAQREASSPISMVSKTDSFSSTEGDGGKRSKRKAPAPPLTTDVELHAEPDCSTDSSSTTIELNATHIPISDESDRKAASLGDLSRITNEEVPASVLERAMSLELTDGIPRDSKKRKAPNPPLDETSLDEAPLKEPRMEGLGLTNLKKASLFGTLEEAIQQTEDDSDSLVSPNSGKSSPDLADMSDGELVSSTPLKISHINIENEEREISHINVENEKLPTVETFQMKSTVEIKDHENPRPAQRSTLSKRKVETVEINENQTIVQKESKSEDSQEEMVENSSFIKDIIGDFSKEMNGEFSKGINGVWHKSSGANVEAKQNDLDVNDAYVTALNISVEDKPPDLPTSPPPNMNSYVTEIKVDEDKNNDEILDISDKDMTLLEQECDDSKIFKNGVYFTTDESLLMNGSISSFSKSTLMESNKITSPSKTETFINNMNDRTTPDVNLSDEQILALKTSTNKITNSNLYKTNGESPSPNKRRIPSKSPSPSGNSPQRGKSPSISSKSSGSRIPVRAFSGCSPSSDASPRSTSNIPDPKIRKSRKPDEPDQNTKFSYSSTFTVSPISKSNVPSPEQRRYNGTNGTTEMSVTQIVVDNQK